MNNAHNINYGLSGSFVPEQWDNLLGLGKNAKKRKSVRQDKRKERHDTRMERRQLKNDQRRAETESLRAETTIAKEMTIGDHSAPATQLTPQVPVPDMSGQQNLMQARQNSQLAIAGVGIGVLVIGFVIFKKMKSKGKIPIPQVQPNIS